MNFINNLFRKKYTDNHQEITAISDIKESTVEIVNNYYAGSDKRVGKEDLQRHMEKYLYGLMDVCASLDWFEQVDLPDEKAQKVKLDLVYTALLTSSIRDNEKDGYSRQQFPYSAVEMLSQHDKLVIAGAPGSGKSAFVNFICLCMAGELLQKKHCNLALLTQPLPNGTGKPGDKQQDWQHGALVPLRIILREFANSQYFPDKESDITVHCLMDFIKQELTRQDCENYYPILKKSLEDGKVLVMFDGLDEVPEADKRRKLIIECIKKFRSVNSRNRFLITVRPYAYQEARWKIAGFSETTLANFSQGQICLFIDLWYQDYDKLKSEVTEKRTEELKNTIFSVKALKELAERPLLLTLMAFLHRNRHELPHRRAALYKELLDLLIKKWEKARFGVKDAGEAASIKQPSLSEFLRVDYDAIYLVLERLAFKAHALQIKGEKGVADISEADLIVALDKLATETNADNPVNTTILRHHLRDRIGILNLRGGEEQHNSMYSFPHRSFQEYLAAAYFAHDEDSMYETFSAAEDDWQWNDLAAYLAQTDPDRWREVIVLAGAIYAGKAGMTDLIKGLLGKELLSNHQAGQVFTTGQSWGLRLAAEILAENMSQNLEGRSVRACQKKLQGLLPELLAANTLPAKERVDTGPYLAKIGDPRPEIMHIDSMQFCKIPAGEFFLGSDDSDSLAFENEKQHAGMLNIDYCYALARFPVTVAQYRRFVETTEHNMLDAACLRGADNTPVIRGDWNEAIKFCDWLTVEWQKKGYLPKGWRVDLPSEPEWEKAARGGIKIPVHAKITAITDELMQELRSDCPLKDNPLKKNIFPWSNDKDVSENSNYAMNIGGVSTPGCYSLGQSPYGCEDMAGNVWEWTRSAYQENYPVNPSEWQQRNEREQKSVRRVLRGGAFGDNDYCVRCAARSPNAPDSRSLDLGFRVVLSPLL